MHIALPPSPTEQEPNQQQVMVTNLQPSDSLENLSYGSSSQSYDPSHNTSTLRFGEK